MHGVVGVSFPLVIEISSINETIFDSQDFQNLLWGAILRATN